MWIRVVIGGQSYSFADEEKARAAAAGLAHQAARYQRLADRAKREHQNLTATLDKAVAEDEAKARAKKEAKRGSSS